MEDTTDKKETLIPHDKNLGHSLPLISNHFLIQTNLMSRQIDMRMRGKTIV